MSDLINHITALDGYHFAAAILLFASFCIYAAAQIAKLGQTQAVEPTDPRDFDANVNARWRG